MKPKRPIVQGGNTVWIGFDPKEAAAFAVCRASVRKHLTRPIPVYGLVLSDLQKSGLYTRPIQYKPSALDGDIMWDVLSDAPMATEFSNSRFLVPHIAKTGWALFMDCDMLVMDNLTRLFDALDPTKAVYVVKHDYNPTNTVKMDGQIQTQYNKKLWSAFCIFNCEHPSNKKLTLDWVNSYAGRHLHAFNWLEDDEIGGIDPAWQWIPGHSEGEPKCVHWTQGGPWFKDYKDAPYAEEYRDSLSEWARGMLSLPS